MNAQRLIFIATALVIGAPIAVAAQPPQIAAHPAPILSAQDLDPLRLLPPPPAEGSAGQKAEIAELHQIQNNRTAAELSRAQYNDAHEDAWVFAAVLGPKFDAAALPATTRLMAQVRRDDEVGAKRAKDDFRRPRPWLIDAGVVGCHHGDGPALNAYPSGHATMIFAAATVLADLVPSHAQSLMRFAQTYAHDRLVCGLHFQSDTVAGEILGTAIGVKLLQRPELTAAIAAARAELLAAGLN